MAQYKRHGRTANILIMARILILPGYACAKSTVESLAELSFEQLLDIRVSSTSFFDIAPEKAPGSVGAI